MKSIAIVLACGLLGAAAPAQQPPAKPLDKSAPEAKPPMSAEEKAKLVHDNARSRYEEFKGKWPAPANVPLVFQDPVRDIGRVTDDAPIKVMFTFKNVSQSTVKVTNTKAGCGCTVPKLAKDTYAPGEEGAIEATYNPQHRKGLEFKDIDVSLDTPGITPLKIGFLVETLPRVVADPVSVYMPDVRRGTTALQKLTITGREPGFDVKSITLADPNAPFTITRGASSEITDDSGDKLTRIEYDIVLNSGVPIGRTNTRLVVSTTDPKRATMEVPLGVAVVGEVRSVPENVMAIGQPGAAFIKEARIDHRMAKPFHILSVETQGIPSEMGVVLDVQGAHSSGQGDEVIGYSLKVAGTFPTGGGNVMGKIIVRTDIPEQPVLEVPFQGVMPIAAQPGQGPKQVPTVKQPVQAPAPGGAPVGK